MKTVLRLLFICLAAALAAGACAEETGPAMHSFADIYRMTVNGAAPYTFNSGEPQVRVATVQAAPAAEIRFTVKPVPGPERWWLIIAGLAAAAWVAHRRLTRSF